MHALDVECAYEQELTEMCICCDLVVLCVARRDLKLSLFSQRVLPQWFQLRKTIVTGGTFCVFKAACCGA